MLSIAQRAFCDRAITRRQIPGNAMHERLRGGTVGVLHQQHERLRFLRDTVPLERRRQTFSICCVARGDRLIVGNAGLEISMIALTPVSSVSAMARSAAPARASWSARPM